MHSALSLYFVEGFLENFEIAGAAGLFACRFNPLLLQRVFGRAIGLVKHAEDAGERERCEFIRS